MKVKRVLHGRGSDGELHEIYVLAVTITHDGITGISRSPGIDRFVTPSGQPVTKLVDGRYEIIATGVIVDCSASEDPASIGT